MHQVCVNRDAASCGETLPLLRLRSAAARNLVPGEVVVLDRCRARRRAAIGDDDVPPTLATRAHTDTQIEPAATAEYRRALYGVMLQFVAGNAACA